MNDFSKFKATSADSGQAAVDKAANGVQDGIDLTQRSVDEGLDKMSDTVDKLQGQAAPLLDKVTERGQQLMDQARGVFDDTTQRVRAKAHDVSDMAIAYTKDEPVKAMLMSAAAGAVLMSLIAMTSRSRR